MPFHAQTHIHAAVCTEAVFRALQHHVMAQAWDTPMAGLLEMPPYIPGCAAFKPCGVMLSRVPLG